MDIIVFLFLLVGVDPLPTYMVNDHICREYVKGLKLPEAESGKLVCTSIVMSKILDI